MSAKKLLRIYTDESAYYGDRKMYEMLAERARDARLGGATVLEARIGFGRSAHLHRRMILEDDQSLVIEIVSDEDRLRAFADELCDIDGIGLMTLESVEVLARPVTPRDDAAPEG